MVNLDAVLGDRGKDKINRSFIFLIFTFEICLCFKDVLRLH